MTLSIKQLFFILAGLVLLSGAISPSQAEPSVNTPSSNLHALQEAKQLFLEGNRTQNDMLVQQAKQKLSLWLKDNQHSADRKIVAEALRSRASISLALGDIPDTLNDYNRSIQYDPIAEVQFGICLLEKSLAATPQALQTCYRKTVQLFADKQTAKNDPNYLIARILSGDHSAIVEYKKQLDSIQDTALLEHHQMIIEHYLDHATCQQLLTTCKTTSP